eukprot:5418873-Prymnesium_polylepis.1
MSLGCGYPVLLMRLHIAILRRLGAAVVGVARIGRRARRSLGTLRPARVGVIAQRANDPAAAALVPLVRDVDVLVAV